MTARKILSERQKAKILKEFRYLCAMCGKPEPHIRHIDNINSNNSDENLLPLCPNHHLLDAHSPTKRLPPAKLALFRKHRDPTIFLPQFQALFLRMEFLLTTEALKLEHPQLKSATTDLIEFVSHLGMGQYYSQKLHKLIGWVEPCHSVYNSPEEHLSHFQRDIQKLETTMAAYPKRIEANRLTSIDLLIECLRFQNWTVKSPYTDA